MNRYVLATSAALTVIGASVLGAADVLEARAGTRAGPADESDLVVTLATPTLNQEVLSDLSDPGLNNVITVRFSSNLRVGDVIDNKNVFNRLTPKVELTNRAFLRLPGIPSVQGNVFRFDPLSVLPTQTLASGQYTLTMRSSLRNTKGNLLNAGARDFSTTFSVGTDLYAPVLRKASPIHLQQNIGLNQRIVLTFNEPIDAASIISTIQVQNAQSNPPTAIPGAGGTGLTVERDGFDVVFTPDPCFGYPPRTTIQMLVQGQVIPNAAAGCANPPAVATTVTDAFGNQFTRDAGLQWTFNPTTRVWESPNGTYDDCTGVYRLAFVTKGVTPPPALIAPGSPQFAPPCTPADPCVAPCGGPYCFLQPSCKAIGSGIYYSTGTGLGQVDLRPFFNRLRQGITDYSLFNAIANAPVRLGRPTGLIVDPRWDRPNGYHTFLYVADSRSATVLVLDSRNFKVIGRLGGFSQPSDVTITTDFGGTKTLLAVTDRAANQVVFIDLQGIAVNLSGQPGAPSPCDAIKDVVRNRQVVQVGLGPTAVFGDGYLNNKLMTCNSLENSISIVDVKTTKLVKTHVTGSNPVDGGFTYYSFGALDAAAIACQGGLVDPNGSVAFYLRLSGGIQPKDGIESSLTDGVKNPTALWSTQQWAFCVPGNFGNSAPIQQWYVSNTGADTVLDLRLSVQGLFGALISVQPVQTRKVGLNPTGALYDGFDPGAPNLWVSIGGLGQFGGMDPNRNLPPSLKPIAGIRRLYTCFTH